MARRWNHGDLASGGLLAGHIVAFTPQTIRARAIAALQTVLKPHNLPAFQPDIVHVAIAVGSDDVIEAVRPTGVQIYSLNNYFHEFAVFRPSWPDQSSPRLVCNYAQGAIGRRYAQMMPFINFLIANWQSRGSAVRLSGLDAEALICSTFVVEVFDAVLGADSPFVGFVQPSRFPLLLPADVVMAPGMHEIPPP